MALNFETVALNMSLYQYIFCAFILWPCILGTLITCGMPS